MSKFVFIKYREVQDSDRILENLKLLCDRLSPEGLEMEHLVYENKLCTNSYIGIQNCLGANQEALHLLIGHINSNINQFNKVGNPLPDGSYSLIRFNEDTIEFFCDKFCSRTLWYSFDDKKIIISNSQRAIVALKEEFKINQKTVSWFLSSGSQGPFLSWDEDVKMITPNTLVQLNIKNWTISISKAVYLFESEVALLSYKAYETYFAAYIEKSILTISKQFKIQELLLPISGGYDSRLLLYILQKAQSSSEITTINWGKKSTGIFDDKQAANELASYYNLKLLDRYLPDSMEDRSGFLKKFIESGDCRIDHFNAFTDNYKLWDDLQKNGFKIIVRGDIPFPTALGVNNRLSRSRIGISQFTDFSNFEEYKFNKLLRYQEDTSFINRKKDESLIQWRDRLYTEFRMPIVTSSFSDLINGYIENRSPMISGELYLIYSKLHDKHKGNKKHIVNLTKKMDKSKISFDALPSIPNQIGVFKNESGIQFLINYLKKIDDFNIIERITINALIEKLEKTDVTLKVKKNLSSTLRNYLSNNLPHFLKAYINSKRKLSLDAITVAYRVVMIDIATKMYNQDSKIFK